MWRCWQGDIFLMMNDQLVFGLLGFWFFGDQDGQLICKGLELAQYRRSLSLEVLAAEAAAHYSLKLATKYKIGCVGEGGAAELRSIGAWARSIGAGGSVSAAELQYGLRDSVEARAVRFVTELRAETASRLCWKVDA